jgi:hypothetical protein
MGFKKTLSAQCVMIDEIALNGNMCFIFIRITLYKHILLMQPRGVCTREMGCLLIIELWLKGTQMKYFVRVF